jgi:triosephosphate isomerase
MRPTVIAGNWKMNKDLGETRDIISRLKERLMELPESRTKVLVFPPFTSLSLASELLGGSGIGLGAQNMSEHDDGAYTGEVSWRMLRSVGCQYVILGHSERRQYFGESDEAVNRKAMKALANQLVPIICVGETLEQREQGQMEAVVSGQVHGTLKGLTAVQARSIILAYEPVWAIGTGRTATPAQAEEVHRLIRGILRDLYARENAETIVIQYGGSVKPENAADLLSQEDIDGALVGGACLDVDSFLSIIKAAKP